MDLFYPRENNQWRDILVGSYVSIFTVNIHNIANNNNYS
jgi:hypothetical protein